jgi:hypothetical protein
MDGSGSGIYGLVIKPLVESGQLWVSLSRISQAVLADL